MRKGSDGTAHICVCLIDIGFCLVGIVFCLVGKNFFLLLSVWLSLRQFRWSSLN